MWLLGANEGGKRGGMVPLDKVSVWMYQRRETCKRIQREEGGNGLPYERCCSECSTGNGPTSGCNGSRIPAFHNTASELLPWKRVQLAALGGGSHRPILALELRHPGMEPRGNRQWLPAAIRHLLHPAPGGASSALFRQLTCALSSWCFPCNLQVGQRTGLHD